MATGCFFGLKDTHESVKCDLYTAIEKLITECGVETFYVGNQRYFDFYTRAALRQLQKKYPHRSPFFHIKGYSEAEGYKAYVGRDDYDWNELLDLAINTGDAKIFNIEFGTKEDIDSWERAKFSIDAVLDVMKNM